VVAMWLNTRLAEMNLEVLKKPNNKETYNKFNNLPLLQFIIL